MSIPVSLKTEKLRRIWARISTRPYSGQKVTPFVAFFLARSGSTYLIEALNSHPKMRATKEHFAHLRQKGKSGKAQIQWARDFFVPYLNGPYQAIGFKTKISDVLDPSGFADLLKELGAHIILLQRNNLIKQMVSVFNSLRLKEATGDWNLYKTENRISPVLIDVEVFQSWLSATKDEKQELEKYVMGLELPTLPMYYEELLLDESRAIAKVCSFLGLGYKPVTGKSIKNTSDDLRKAVLNFEELLACYTGTPYEAMFHEILRAD